MKQVTTRRGWNFRQRKYYMLMWELVLFILLVTVMNIINALFPMTSEPIRQGDQALYMVFALADILLLTCMGVVAGYWFNDWKRDKELWEDDPTEP